ncbi:MAG: TspO/MBR family protein [Candidatus Shapirobacteria bacterium]
MGDKIIKKINWTRLIVAILIPQIIGGAGAIFTTPKIQGWYVTLNKPFFSPPNWVFGPVWTILFLMMGISLYLRWGKNLKWFWIQLFLNFLWSVIFFGMENPGLALAEILILWWAIFKTIKSFDKVGVWLYPYLAWVSFASLLNAGIWYLN